MQPDDQPYCGAEMLPHATFADGSPAPTICTRPLHGLDSMHNDEKHEASWQWQDAGGNWVHALGVR